MCFPWKFQHLICSLCFTGHKMGCTSTPQIISALGSFLCTGFALFSVFIWILECRSQDCGKLNHGFVCKKQNNGLHQHFPRQCILPHPRLPAQSQINTAILIISTQQPKKKCLLYYLQRKKSNINVTSSSIYLDFSNICLSLDHSV